MSMTVLACVAIVVWVAFVLIDAAIRRSRERQRRRQGCIGNAPPVHPAPPPLPSSWSAPRPPRPPRPKRKKRWKPPPRPRNIDPKTGLPKPKKR